MMTEQKQFSISKQKDPFLEQKKNQLLAALYENDLSAAERIFVALLEFVEKKTDLDEYSEKLLTQVKTLVQRFKRSIDAQDSPGLNAYQGRLKKRLLNTIKQSCDNICHVDFQEWESRIDLNKRQKNLLYKTAMTFQLTSGCSNYCRRCNEWALPKVRSHFSFAAVIQILDQLAAQKNDEISLYGASDPLDWQENEMNISAIIAYIDTLDFDYSILTKIPRGKTSLLMTLLNSNANLSVSMTSTNKTRIKKIEQNFGRPISKQHDLDDLLIPAGLDEDFASIKPSITDGYGVEITPDGVFAIIPTFTSALHPFGHKKIQITTSTTFFPIKKTGRNALLVDYFKPLEGYDLDQNRCHLPSLIDVQIESILLDNGTDDLTPPGMRSLKEYLSIFQEKARIQRHKMTPSIMRHLKRQALSARSFRQLQGDEKDAFLKKIHRHLNLCNKKKCSQLKLYALSYFLDAISNYIKKNTYKIKIIQFLLKHDIQCAFKTFPPLINGRAPEDVFMDSTNLDSFEMFRFYVFCLLTRPGNDDIFGFINAFPAVYDPVSDIFIRQDQGSKK